MKKIGILGGTFNPIQNGHIVMARRALVEYELDKVYFMPNKIPPHKTQDNLISNKDRINLLKLAIKDMDYFDILDIEFKREGKSYTYQTLEELKKQFVDDEIYFIIGADSMVNFSTWKYPERILANAILLVAPRNNLSQTYVDNIINDYVEKCNADIRLIHSKEEMVSSTDVRLHIANGESVTDLLPKPVYDYIIEKGLYKDLKCKLTDYESTNVLKDDLFNRLSRKRFEHTICVANMCAALAMRYDTGIFKAYLAGLFHDIAKDIPDEELLDICRKNCININIAEEKSPYLLHGKVGAYIAKTEYNLSDVDMLMAITYHTTGRPDMSLLEKIVFVADYIEPMRDKATNLAYIRRLAFDDIDKAVKVILDNTLNYLSLKGKPIDNTTKLAYEFYKYL